MYQIKFRYKDEWSHDEWCYQECLVHSVEQCIRDYGLDDIIYEILSVKLV